MKRRILPLLLVLCLLWLTGCSFDDTSDEDLLQEIYGYYQSGKDKTDAPLTSFALPVLQGQTLDPITCPDGVQQTIGALLYEGLYALDTGFTPQPMLAESCTVSGTTCTITLRGGVTFSDGSAVTASDVVRSLQRAQSSERYGARLAGVSRIAAGSGGTVVLTLAYENQNIAALLDIPRRLRPPSARARMSTPRARAGASRSRGTAHGGRGNPSRCRRSRSRRIRTATPSPTRSTRGRSSC